MKTFEPIYIEIEIEDYEIEILNQARNVLYEIIATMEKKSCTTLDTDEDISYSINTIKNMYNFLKEFYVNTPNTMY